MKAGRLSLTFDPSFEVNRRCLSVSIEAADKGPDVRSKGDDIFVFGSISGIME